MQDEWVGSNAKEIRKTSMRFNPTSKMVLKTDVYVFTGGSISIVRGKPSFIIGNDKRS